jgi:hypothetical protein
MPCPVLEAGGVQERIEERRGVQGMIEISPEEFVKRRLEYRTVGEEREFYDLVSKYMGDYNFISNSNIILLDREGWEKVKKIIEDLDIVRKSILDEGGYIDGKIEELKKLIRLEKNVCPNCLGAGKVYVMNPPECIPSGICPLCKGTGEANHGGRRNEIPRRV